MEPKPIVELHILGILLMNSCNTDIFFSNYYNLQSVRFELIELVVMKMMATTTCTVLLNKRHVLPIITKINELLHELHISNNLLWDFVA